MNDKHNIPEALKEIAVATGGKITEIGELPDGSGFAMLSTPLPTTHWIYGDPSVERKGFEPPPMVFRMGVNDDAVFATQRKDQPPPEIMTRKQVAEKIRAAGQYAVRSATMKGKEMDFDPDALIQNLIVGMLGYWTNDGLDHDDEWTNPATHD